ncbi:MAG TPA: LysM domain-containing protein [Acidimicrobiales bacterium]
MAALAYAPRIGPNGHARRNRRTHVGELGASTTLRLVAVPASGQCGVAAPPVAFRPVIVQPAPAPLPDEEVVDAPITPLRRTDAPREIERRDVARRASERRRAAKLRRRRVHLLGVAATSVALASALWIGTSAMASQSQDRLQVLPGSAKVAHGYLYTVQAGDTVWSIATRLDPAGDPRPIADQIETEIGGTNVQVGTQVLVP